MKALVIGYGVMGRNHARTLRRLGHEVETIDPDPFAGADWLEARPLPTADWACIATPPTFLAQEAAPALRAGMNVLVEKPMAGDIDQAQALLQAELASPGRVFVGYVERWNSAVVALRKFLPLVGQLREITIHRLGLTPRCPETGPALDLLTHDVDVLRFLGLWPRLLHASGDGPHLCATFSVDAGARATLHASHDHPTKRRTLAVEGEQGTLSLDYQRQTLVFHRGSKMQEIEIASHPEPLAAMWSDVLEGRGVKTGDALATLRLALGAEDTARQREPVAGGRTAA